MTFRLKALKCYVEAMISQLNENVCSTIKVLYYKVKHRPRTKYDDKKCEIHLHETETQKPKIFNDRLINKIKNGNGECVKETTTRP